MFTARPLCSTMFPWFPRYYGLSDSQPRQTSRLCIPGHPSAPSPGRSGSPRFLGASFRARSSQPPRGALQVHMPIASPQVSDFVIFGSLAAPNWRIEAESDSLSLGLTRSRSTRFKCFAIRPVPDYRSASHVRLPSHRGPPLHGERAITIAGTFSQQDAPGLAWRSKDAEDGRQRTEGGGQRADDG